MVDAPTQTLQCPLNTNYCSSAVMVSKLWTCIWGFVNQWYTDHDHDRKAYPKQRAHSKHICFSDHQRLLTLTLMMLVVGQQLCSLPAGVTGARVGSSKRRITGSNGGKSLAEWDDIFQQRTDSDWRELWHKEKHKRCQHQLLSHMELVCEKDIYKLARRRRRKRDLAAADGTDSFPSDDSPPAASEQQQQEDFDAVLGSSDSDLGLFDHINHIFNYKNYYYFFYPRQTHVF